MNSSKHCAVLSVSTAIFLLSLNVAAQDHSVVPGQRVGAIRLGATRSETAKSLGKPSETKRWRSGLIKESWLEPEKPNSEDPQVSFSVIYRANRVVQIEFNDPKYATAEGISVGSTLAQFRAKHKHPRVKAYGYDDGEGSGYVGYYFDDVRGGIAFTFRTQDLFDARVEPESLCVHAASRSVITETGGKPHRATDEQPVPKVASTTALNQRAQRTRPNKTAQELEAVVRQFWDGLGRLDAELIKQSVDFPVMIVESSSTGSKQANVVRTPSEIDEEMKRAPESAVKKGRGEFFGTKLTDFKVQMFGADMASVSYYYRLAPDMLARNPLSKSGAAYAMTVLRRGSGTFNGWRIVFTTVPK